MRQFILLSLCLALAACGFQPLHGQAYRQQHAIDLSAMTVDVDHTRRGQLLEAEIEDAVNPDFEQAKKLYRLDITMKDYDTPLFINPDGTSARGDIEVHSEYKLRRIADGKLVGKGTIRRTSSYNTSDQASEGYASYVSVEDAKKRAVMELAQDYKLRMANLLAKLSARE